VYRPPPNAPVTALALHLHGGAFVGGLPEHGSTVAALLAGSGAVVLSLDYPTAPEHPFPQGAEAAYAALAWMLRQRRRLGAGDAPLVVAGEEAGGNIAAAVALMARDRDSPRLAAQVLLSPMLDVCTGSASLRAQAEGARCPWAEGWRKYLARACDALHPYATPGASMRLGGLPPTLLVTACDDPLRDETRAYAKRLRKAGVGVDEVVLQEATGWPATYLQPPTLPARWHSAVREHVQRFLRETAHA
jgi:acetyl esterase/lipase